MSGERSSLARGGLLAALLLGAAVRWTGPMQVADLCPRPDALEYEESARNLAHGEGYCLVFGGRKYTPHYPFGFPALLAPWLRVADDQPGAGIRVVLASSLAAIAATWALALRAGGPASAIVAGLVLALSPLHARWSRAVMSDVPASAAVALVAAWASRTLAQPGRSHAWLGIGACAALAATIRPTNAFLVPPLVAVLALGPGPGRLRARRLAALAAGIVVGTLPTLAFNVAHFGSPLSTGYSGWVPIPRFGLRYVLGRPVGVGNAGSQEPNLLFYMRVLAGGGSSLYPWPIALMAVLGAIGALGRPGPQRAIAGLAVAGVATLTMIQLGFFWQWDRFLLPALPLIALLASLPFGVTWPRAARWGAAVLALASLPLLPRPYPPPDSDLGEVSALRAIERRVEPDAAIIMRTNVFFFRQILRHHADRVWLPLGITQEAGLRASGLRPYATVRQDEAWVHDALQGLPFRADGAETAVRALLAEGRPTYFSDLLAFQVPFMDDMRRLLAARFLLEPPSDVGPWHLFRVRRREETHP
jgi:4-amino-4-deoxy-L-arabinose transferase-like glycosyltransferase